MTKQQKIQPVVLDVEAPAPKVPLVPPSSASSEKGNSIQQLPPERAIPVIQTRPPKKIRNCCCKCICWTISLIVLLLIMLGATVGILYLVFRPKLPN
ncbi:hypothetical protein REPUB_Repub06bG0098000 [Reevesia pubescens]